MKFLNKLQQAKAAGKQVVIPDIKRYSPKDGELLAGRSPADYAECLIRAGAPVLSVVTEEKEFHGSLQMLREVADVAEKYDVPILRKDFIHTKEDLQETLDHGASAILLMCSCLEKEELSYLYREALAVGLDPFVETHRAEDFALVRELGAELVGINNRDILQLERDDGNVSHTLQLAGLAPENTFLVTESSIRNPSEVRAAIRSGADAALVGTAISLAPDPGTFYRMLTQKVSLKICGLMQEADVDLCVQAGVERIGLVTEFPLAVPWNISAERAAELRKCIPAGFQAVMVTGGSAGEILQRADAVRPDLVQLHHEETLEETAFLAAELETRGIGVIRTVPMNREACLRQYDTEDMEEIIQALCRTKVAELLIDPRHGKDIAKKKLQADEELFAWLQKISTKPVILAGGLTGENLAETIARTGAEAVDIMNGSEDAPGRKSREKIRSIVQALRE